MAIAGYCGRAGFTWIEVLIVLAAIAVAMAFGVPWLLQKHDAAREQAAYTALKSGILPAEVQFQAGAYLDQDVNGIGEYATCTGLGRGLSYRMLAGGITTPGGQRLNLLAPAYALATPEVSGYRFKDPLSVVSGEERVWAVLAQPVDAYDGRRLFAINQAGNVQASGIEPDAWLSTEQATGRRWFGPTLMVAPPASPHGQYNGFRR